MMACDQEEAKLLDVQLLQTSLQFSSKSRNATPSSNLKELDCANGAAHFVNVKQKFEFGLDDSA